MGMACYIIIQIGLKRIVTYGGCENFHSMYIYIQYTQSLDLGLV